MCNLLSDLNSYNRKYHLNQKQNLTDFCLTMEQVNCLFSTLLILSSLPASQT